jgi:insertion element IS1 protein InsB
VIDFQYIIQFVVVSLRVGDSMDRLKLRAKCNLKIGILAYHMFQVVTCMKCHYCNGRCIRKGFSKNTPEYRCSSCLKYQREKYSNKSWQVKDSELILLTKEGCGIRSISRILEISPTTTIRRIVKIGTSIRRQVPILFGKHYQMDELFTYVGHKNNRICIAYAIEQYTREVVDFVVRRRNKNNLRKVLNTLFLTDAKQIVTDKLNLYTELISSDIHSTKFRGINTIERKNLTLRTHLKRLNRRTICYSKQGY